MTVLCLVIYFFQYRNEQLIEAHAAEVCAQLPPADAKGYVWWKWFDFSCAEAVVHVYYSPDPEAHLAWHVDDMLRRGESLR